MSKYYTDIHNLYCTEMRALLQGIQSEKDKIEAIKKEREMLEDTTNDNEDYFNKLIESFREETKAMFRIRVNEREICELKEMIRKNL